MAYYVTPLTEDIKVRGMNSRSAFSRIADKAMFMPNGCIEFTGSISPLGYGSININGQTKSHRVAYQELVGPIPEGLTLDHLCKNRACMNPAHLEPVTLRENILRGDSPQAKNARRDKCECGGPLTPHPKRPRRRCIPCDRRRDREKMRRYRAERRNRAATQGTP